MKSTVLKNKWFIWLFLISIVFTGFPPAANSQNNDTTPPTKPTNLVPTVLSASEIRLNWYPSTDASGNPRYRVYRGSIMVGEVYQNSFIDQNLSADTAYIYKVVALDPSNNQSPYSDPVDARTLLPNSSGSGGGGGGGTTQDTIPPTVPTGLYYERLSANYIRLGWAASSDNVAVTAYKVYRNNAYRAQTSTVQIYETDLVVSTQYYYNVAAMDAAGNTSSLSAPYVVNLPPYESAPGTTPAPSPTPPPPPATTSNTDTTPPMQTSIHPEFVSPTEVKVLWNTTEPAIPKIYYSAVSGQYNTLAAISCSAGTGVSNLSQSHCIRLTNLEPGKKYYYKAFSTDAASNTGQSPELYFVTLSAAPDVPASGIPIAPTQARAQLNTTNNDIVVLWNDNSQNETGFKIGRRTAGGAWSTAGTTGTNITSFLNLNVLPGNYEYDVAACNQLGCSAYSNIAGVTVPQTSTTAGFQITGSVKSESGEAVNDAYVDAYLSGQPIVSRPVDSLGKYSLPVGGGTWYVFARPKDPGTAKWVKTAPQTVVASTTSTSNFVVKYNLASFEILATSTAGSPVAGIGVVVSTGACSLNAVSELSVSGITDSTGKAMFLLPPAVYCARVSASPTANLVNPEPAGITVAAGQNNQLKFVFNTLASADREFVNGVVVDNNGVEVTDAFVGAASTSGMVVSTKSSAGGKFSLSLLTNHAWVLVAKKIIGDQAFTSSEMPVDPMLSGELEIRLAPVATVGAEAKTAAPSTQDSTAQTSDGAVATVRAGSVSTQETLNLSVKPTVDVPPPPKETIIGSRGFDVNLTGSSGQKYTQLLLEAEILIPYDDSILGGLGLTPEKVAPKYFDETVAQWKPVKSFAIDKVRKVFVVKTDHFTIFALVAAADTVPPITPTSVNLVQVSTSSIKLSWSDPKADYHHTKVYRSEVASSTGSVLANLVTGGTYTDTGLSVGTTYYYRVQSVDASGNESALTSASSLKMSATVPPQGQIHAVGTNIKASDGTIYMVSPDAVKRPYTSAGAFISYMFNLWKDVVDATPSDLALPTGTFIPPQDGKLICSDRGADKGTCYFITGSKKAGIVSEKVFSGLGFSFQRSSFADVSWMESTSNIQSESEEHKQGALVNHNGTVYYMGKSSRLGFPTLETFASWGYQLADVVTANPADLAISESGVISPRNPGELSPQ